MGKKFLISILPVVCLSFFPLSACADDGASGLAGLIGAGFILICLILVFAFLTLVDSFLNDREKHGDSKLIVKLLKLAVPIGIIVAVNAIMIQGHLGFSAFVNTLNGIIALCLVIVCVLAPGQKKLNYVTTGSWLVVVLLILYVFWEWNVLSWFL